MGCEYPNHLGDNDLLTTRAENLQINGLSLPENDII